MNIRPCLAKLQAELAGFDTTEIQTAMQQHIAQGVPAKEAAIAAVTARRQTLATGRQDVVRQAAEKYQGGAVLAQGNRGALDPHTLTMALLQNADLSTFVHELGHFNLEVMADIAARPDAPADVVADFQRIMTWFGVDPLAWQSMTLDEKRPYHEKFAEGFETFLIEGKAPSVELQTVFQRIRSWMLRVYKSLKDMRIQLTDDVRGVFDRMLATDQQIQVSTAENALTPLFTDAAQAGMTPAAFAEYQAEHQAAVEDAKDMLNRRSVRDMRFARNLHSRKLKELSKDAEAKYQAVRGEVTAEVEQLPVYQALKFLRTGVMPDGAMAESPVKLSMHALDEMYGPDSGVPYSSLPPGKNGLVAKDGAHPNAVAAIFGFKDGDALVRALLDAAPIDQVVEGATDQRVLERYGDITNPTDLARAADEAVHTDVRGRFIATELAALNRTQAPARVLQKMAKRMARAIVGRVKIAKLTANKYKVQAVRSAKAAEQALRANDLVAAADAKRAHLVNFEATTAAQEALAKVEKGLKFLKQFEKESTRKAIDYDYLDQIDALLERFDLRTSVSAKDIAKRKSFRDWLKAQEEAGFEPDVPDALVNEAYRTSYKEMTVEEFAGLVDTIRQIDHLGKLKRKLLTSHDERELDARIDEATASIRENATKTLPSDIEHNQRVQRFKSMGTSFLVMHRKLASLAREMDGMKDGGPMWDLIVRPMNEAGDRETQMRNESAQALNALMRKVKGDLKEMMHIPAINRSMSREGRLAVALNTGNDINRQRLRDGDAWSDEQIDAIVATLTKDEMDFVQGVWDHLETYWPKIVEKQKMVYGTLPEKVDPSPVVTPHGTYRGGYYPIKYDAIRSSQAAEHDAQEILNSVNAGRFAKKSTRRGHLQQRANEVKRPMRKDLDVIFQHVNQVTHDLAWHPWLIDFHRVIGSKRIDSAIRDHYGVEVLTALRKTAQDIAVGDLPAQNVLEGILNHLRTGVTVAGLGWNFVTAALQPIGYTQSVVRIGGKWVARGMGRFLGSPLHMVQQMKDIRAKSQMMAQRDATLSREINEIRNRIKRGKHAWRGKLEDTYFLFIAKMQGVVDGPTWQGAYEKALYEGAGEDKAIALADQAVLDSQGGGQIKDLAEIQRGSAFQKLFTNFYSFFNTTYNLAVERTKVKRVGAVQRAQLLTDYLLLLSIPALMGTVLKAAVSGALDDDDLPEKVLKDQLSYLLGMSILTRDIGSAITFKGGYTGPTGLRFYSEFSKLIVQAEQGEADEAFWKSLNNTLGIVFHYPAGQVQRTFLGVDALLSGETENPGAIIVGPPKD